MKKLYVVYHTGFGHTKRQAEAVHQGASSVDGVESVLLTTEEAAERLDELDGADAIVFGSPTYMGSLSADMKKFFEVAGREVGYAELEDKIAGGFTNSGSFSGDKLSTLTSMFYNAMQHGMIWVGLGMLPAPNDRDAMKTIEGPGPDAHNRNGSYSGAMSSSFECGPDVAPSRGDLETAELYGKRVAEVTLRIEVAPGRRQHERSATIDSMTLEVAFMLVLLGVALVAFVKEWFPIEVTALGVLAILVVTRILDVREALAGFRSTAVVVAIASLFVLSYALTKTGLLEAIADRVFDAARDRPWPMIVVLLGLVCFGSGLLNNTAVVALSIPLVLKLCRRLEMSPSKVLLPLSYASILGGTLTLIGTSTNLLVNSVVVDWNQKPLGMFEFTTLGAIIAAAGLTYITLAARRRLPARAATGEFTRKYRMGEFLSELALTEGSRLVGRNLVGERINERYRVTVLEVIRGPSEAYLEEASTIMLQPGDLLIVQGEVDDILRLRREQQLTTAPEVKLDDQQLVAGGQLLEAWVTPGSRMIGRTLKELAFHSNHGGYVLAINRARSTLRRRVAETRLRQGDALLILIPPDRMTKLQESGDVVIFSEREISLRKGRLWWLPVVVLPAVVVTAAVGWLDIAASALVGAVVVVLARVITPQEAYRAVDWSVVLVIAAFVPIGHAFHVTGTADYLARSVLATSSWAPPDLLPYVVLTMVYLVTVVLTQIVSNNAAAVVVAPIVLSLGPALDVDSRPFVMAVCFAASAAFLTPMGYQTNLMVHAAGEYRFIDYLRFGAPLNLLVWLLAVVLIPMIWPF